MPENLLTVLNFELKFPSELPKEIRFLSEKDPMSQRFNDVIIPEDSFAWIMFGEGRENFDISLNNVRKRGSMERTAFLIVDTSPNLSQ